MKYCYIILFILLLQSIMGRTQGIFAPVGAEWYQDAAHGVYRVRITGDTIIQGTPCRRIEQTAFEAPPYVQQGYQMWYREARFMYSNADTVFIFNNLFNRFTPLFVFNVNAGDTLRLPLFDPEDGFFYTLTDSITIFRVDSVKTILYDTSHLKTVFVTNISSPLSTPGAPGLMAYTWNYNGDTSSAYAEKIGSIHSGFQPYLINGGNGLPSYYDAPFSLRCYHDSNTSIKLVTGECDKGIAHTGVYNIPSLSKATPYLFPNPATAETVIKGMNIQQATVTDMQGKLLIKLPFDHNTALYNIDLHSLPTGIYTVRVQEYDGSNTMLKLTVTK